MIGEGLSPEVCRLLGRVLEYPHQPTWKLAQECAALLEKGNPGAAARLSGFVQTTKRLFPGALQELYTSTFDLQPACCLYAGYHLFGESQKRSMLMIGLREEYARVGFGVDGELPDHAAKILAFLAVCEDGELKRSLVEDCLVPTMTKVERSISASGNPYAAVASSVLLLAGTELQDSSERAKESDNTILSGR